MSKKRPGDGDSARSANENQTAGRRSALKRLFAGGAAAGLASSLPTKWTRPVVDSVMLPVHAQTSAEPDGDFFDGEEDITSAPAWLNWMVPAAHAAVNGCSPDRGCARIRNGVITLFVTIDGYCYRGDGQVGQTATLEPVEKMAYDCDTIKVDILELRGTAPNRVLVVDEGRELRERTDGECSCDSLTRTR